ncbi:MAG: DUF2520 domain-containing protein [Flavipsychrobacter sp.]|nr:DUF2520 domain-containing protein [Flavipsychrobacter sp.]
MTFSIIGTGNMAWFLAKRLTTAGHQCIGIYGRDKAATIELAEWIQAKSYSNIADIYDGEIDVCLLSISDHAIETVAPGLHFKKTVLIHTAGSVDLDLLSKSAVDYAVLWPVYSVVKNNLPNHRNIPCAWQASTPKAQRYVLSLAHGITDVIFEAKDEQRKWLHLSAVVCNNFVNHLMAIGEQTCHDQQLDFNILHPIIAQTFERLQKTSPFLLQTGPAKRGDSITIARHMKLLDNNTDWQRVYSAITTSIENMYRQNDTKNEVKP